jgi:hypothetical protein
MTENTNQYVIPWRALAFAPLVSIPIVTLMGLGTHGDWFSDLRAGIFVAIVFIFPVFYIALISIGAPVYFILIRYRIFNIWVVCGLSSVPPLLLLRSEPLRVNFFAVAACIAVGGVAFVLSPKNITHSSSTH